MEQTGKSEKVLAYIESAKAKGAADDFLVGLIREQGWAAEDIYGEPSAMVHVPRVEKASKYRKAFRAASPAPPARTGSPVRL